MSFFRPLALSVSAALLTSAAWAAPSTPEGAARLLAVFQTYLGPTEGLVAVVPEGETYTLTIDPAPLAALGADAGLTATISPLVMHLTELGGGDWGVSMDQAFTADVVVPGSLQIKVGMARIASEGTFNESLRTFSSSAGTVEGLVVDEVISVPDAEQTVHYEVPEMTYASKATADPLGGVSYENQVKFGKLIENISMPLDPSLPAMDFGVTVEGYDVASTATGVRPEAFLALLAFFVAHPSVEAITADQAVLKSALSGGLPFFETMTSAGTTGPVTISSPFGVFGLTSTDIAIEARGVVADGRFREAFGLHGLTVPEGLLPGWAGPLLPTDLTLDLAISGFDLAAPARMILEALDLSADPPIPDTMGDALLAALMPGGAVDITLAPGTIIGPDYALNFEGAMRAGPMEPPTGQAVVSMTGMDGLLAALGAAPQEEVGQIVMALGMAQSMGAAQEDGSLVWDIDATTPGSVKINGMDMMGGQ